MILNEEFLMNSFFSIKKYAISAVAAPVVTACLLSGCSYQGTAEELYNAADTYMEAVLSRKISKISDLSSVDFEDQKPFWKSELDYSSPTYTDEEIIVLEAVSDSMSYEVIPDSAYFDAKTGEGYVDVEITMADYAALSSDHDVMESPESFAAALESDRSKQYVIRVEFELSGDRLLVANHEEILNSCYSFVDSEFTYYPPLEELIYGISFYSPYYGGAFTQYINCGELVVSLSYEPSADTSGIYWKVEHDDEVVYISDVGVTEFDFDITVAPADPDRPDSFDNGDYTFTIYDGDDEAVYSDSFTENNTVYRPSQDYDWLYTINDQGDYAIYNDTDVIELDYYGDYVGTDVFYRVLYEGEIVYTSDIGIGRSYGYFRADYIPDLMTDSGYLIAGKYEILFYNESGIFIGGGTAIVLNDNAGLDGTYVGAFIGYDIIGDEFSYVIYEALNDPFWMMTDGRPEDRGIYDSGVDSIELVITSSVDIGAVTFYVLYSATGGLYDQQIVSEEFVVTSMQSDDGLFYFFLVYESDAALSDGYYIIRSRNDDGEALVISCCSVGEIPG